MDTTGLKSSAPPEGFVLDEAPPEGFVLDEPTLETPQNMREDWPGFMSPVDLQRKGKVILAFSDTFGLPLRDSVFLQHRASETIRSVKPTEGMWGKETEEPVPLAMFKRRPITGIPTMLGSQLVRPDVSPEVRNAGMMEDLENYYKLHPEERPRQFAGFWDELMRSTAGQSMNVASGLMSTLASNSPDAIWDKNVIQDWADKLYALSKKPEFAPSDTSEGGAIRAFVANSMGSVGAYMGAATVATIITGTPLAAFVVAYAVEGDNAYRDAIAGGGTEEQAQMNRFIVGTINGAIEQLQVGQIFKFAKTGRRSMRAILDTARRKAWRTLGEEGVRVGYEAVKNAAQEGLEEALQEVSSVVAESYVHPMPLVPAVERIGAAGLGGAIAGTILASSGRVAVAIKERGLETEFRNMTENLTKQIVEETNIRPEAAAHIAADAVIRHFGIVEDLQNESSQQETVPFIQEIFETPLVPVDEVAGFSDEEFDPWLEQAIEQLGEKAPKEEAVSETEKPLTKEPVVATVMAEGEEQKDVAENYDGSAFRTELAGLKAHLAEYGSRLTGVPAEEFARISKAVALHVGTLTKEQAVTMQVAQAAGWKIIFIKNGTAFNGISLKDGSRTVFVDIDSKTSALSVLGHEVDHKLGELYAEDPSVKKWDKVLRESIDPDKWEQFKWRINSAYKARGLKLLTDNQVWQEFRGDAMGDAMQSEVFWKNLKKNDKKLWKRLIAYVMNFLQSIKDRISQPSFKYLKATKVTNAIRAASEAYRAGAQISNVEPAYTFQTKERAKAQAEVEVNVNNYKKLTADQLRTLAGALMKQQATPKTKQNLKKISRELGEKEKEEMSGISRRERARLVAETRKDIEAHPFYEIAQHRLDEMNRRILDHSMGLIYVPAKFKAEVYDIIGYPQGKKKTRLQSMFTFDPAEQASQWDVLVQQGFTSTSEEGQTDTSAYMDISEFVRYVKDSVEGNAFEETVGELLASRNPYDVALATRYDMQENGGYTLEEITEAEEKIVKQFKEERDVEEGRNIPEETVATEEETAGKEEEGAEAVEEPFGDFFDFLPEEERPPKGPDNIAMQVREGKEPKKPPAAPTGTVGLGGVPIRPALKGGAAGKQMEAWNKEDFLTLKERERLNALKDVEGQQKFQFQIREGTFFSKLERTVEEKMQPKMDAQALMNMLKKAGVKNEEIEWMGISDLKGMVTKQQALDTIRSNNVQIEEVEKLRERPIQSELAGDVTNETHFEQYQLPGGRDYRELLLKLPVYRDLSFEEFKADHKKRFPESDISENELRDAYDSGAIIPQEGRLVTAIPKNVYKSSHWAESNVLAHVRFNDRTDAEGKRVLFLEEIQSDWHQAGRKKGYKEPNLKQENFYEYIKRKNPEITVEEANAKFKQGHNDSDFTIWMNEQMLARDNAFRVPNAPFKKTWHELVLKRMLRYAAENGYDKLAWTTGEQQAERYDLSKQVERITWNKKSSQGSGIYVAAHPVGRTEQISKMLQPNELADFVGKEIADKIINGGDYGAISGEGLKVGGEGMKGFYDKIIPDFLNKYAKKWGGKVEETRIDVPSETAKNYTTEQSEDGTWYLSGHYGETLQEGFASEEDALDFMKEMETRTPVHSLAITPDMKQSVMEGQPLFAIRETPESEELYKQFEAARKKKIAQVHILAKQKGLMTEKGTPKPGYRTLAADITGKTSAAKMNSDELDLFIEGLRAMSRGLKPKQSPIGLISKNPAEKITLREEPDTTQKLKQTGKRAGRDLRQIISEFFTGTDFRLENISLELFQAVRGHSYDVLMNTKGSLDGVKEFLDEAGKIPHKEWRQLDFALKTSDQATIKTILEKYNLQEDYAQVRDVLDDIYGRAENSGIKLNYREEHYPREVKDMQGLMEYFYDSPYRTVIMDAIKAKEQEYGRDLNDQEKAEIINSLLRGYRVAGISLARPGHAKERTIQEYTSDIDMFYHDSKQAIVNYIKQMEQSIADNEFFGKVSKETGKLRVQARHQRNRIALLSKMPGELAKKNLADAEMKLAKIEKELEKTNYKTNPNETIGAITNRLLAEGKIKPGQDRELKSILQAYFHPATQGRIQSWFLTAGYGSVLGNSVLHNIQQLAELALAVIESPEHMIPATVRAVLRKSKITAEDMALRIYGEELREISMAKAVDRLLHITLWTDLLGKEVLVNTAVEKAFAEAQNPSRVFLNRLNLYFGDDMQDVLDDMKRREITDDVKFYAFNVLSDWQPISRAQMPQKWLTARTGRLFYALKQFTLRRTSAIVQMARRDFRNGDYKRGISRLVLTAAILGGADAGADFLKDLLRGKVPKDISDYAIDSLLRYALMSKYQVERAKGEGVAETFMEGFLPPTPLIDDVYKAVANDRYDRLTKSIPLAGDVYYWWFDQPENKTVKRRPIHRKIRR